MERGGRYPSPGTAGRGDAGRRGGRGMLDRVLPVLDAESATENKMCLKYGFLFLLVAYRCNPAPSYSAAGDTSASLAG